MLTVVSVLFITISIKHVADLFILVWAFQAGQSSTVIENIHTIIAAAAVKFSFDQLTHLFVLIQKVSTVPATFWK